MKDINLLLPKDEESLQRKKRVKVFNVIAVVFLLGIGAISFIIFISAQAINLSAIKKEQADTLIKISQFSKRQVKLFVLENRVNNIQTILSKRKHLPKAIGAILKKTPDRLLIQDLTVDDKNVVMIGQSISLSVIGEFINNLADMVAKKEIINAVTLNSLVFDESKNYYQISIKADL